MTVYFDNRWKGMHGIGRFAKALESALRLPPLDIKGIPTSPLDPIVLYFSMRKLRGGGAVFSPGYNAPLFMPRPYVFTIHDLNHIDRKENSSVLKRLYYNLVIKRACHKAFRILTVSEFSRNRISSWAKIPKEKVINVGNGVEDCFNQNVLPYDPGYPYFFSVSNRKAHKNEDRLIEAFSQANIGLETRLLLTGESNDALSKVCQRCGVYDRVIFVGSVSESELARLYRGALALVFPSLYEGFGLPVIEAMACGTPVITSNTTSLPEVSGGAALLIDPNSVKDIKNGIERLYKDKILRKTLSKKGVERAAMFTWGSVANKVRLVLDELNEDKCYY